MKILYLLLLTFTFVACKDKIIEKVEIDFCEKIKTEGIQIERTEFGFAGFKRVYNQSGLLIAIKSLSYKVDTDSLKYDNQNKLVVRIKYNAFDGKGIGKAGEIDSLSYDIKNKLLGIKTYYFAEKQILMRKSTSFFYNVGGHIEKQITETGPRQIKYRFEWQNNNMIKSDVLNFADEVIYSTIFEYDNKKNSFSPFIQDASIFSLYLPQEYILSDNNIIKVKTQDFTIQGTVKETELLYEYCYNSNGLPTFIKYQNRDSMVIYYN